MTSSFIATAESKYWPSEGRLIFANGWLLPNSEVQMDIKNVSVIPTVNEKQELFELSNKIYKHYGKVNLKDYINNFMMYSIFKNRYFTVLIAFVLVSINLLQAQTNVSGNITTNTTWTKAASPYNLTSNVIVDNGATLTVEPGVVVEAKGHIYLSVLGKIIAVGTEADSIYFKGNGVKGFWTGNKIRYTGGNVVNADYTYASGSKFSYVSVADADLGVYIFNNSFFIEKSIFRNNFISCEHRATTISIIKNSKFFNNSSAIKSFYIFFILIFNIYCF